MNSDKLIHYLVSFRDGGKPKDVFSLSYVVKDGAYVFCNPSGYVVESFPVYLVASIVEVRAERA